MGAYQKGFELGLNWIGPNGDGTLGVLSLDFIRTQAEVYACGFRFSDLTHVTEEEEHEAKQFMRGFHEGLACQRDW